MANLEDIVLVVVQDLMAQGAMFTALDVSNAVKQQLPLARHREVRDVVRSLFATTIESQGWARTPITVNLADGTTAEALLYHDLSKSWDLDNEYDAQKRAQVAVKPVASVQAPVVPVPVAQTATNLGLPVPTTPQPMPQIVPAPVAVAMPTARTLWDSLFQTQPSLFPKQ